MMRTLLPFTYFLVTRLNKARSFAFHLAYEWIPSLGLAYIWSGVDGLWRYALAYLAFISIYELGYALNDQLSHHREGERQRHPKMTLAFGFLFGAIRLATFIAITLWMAWGSNVWWTGFAALAVIFLAHNLLHSPSLKTATFILLSFLRYTLPLFPVGTLPDIQVLMVPILLNYSVFRMFIYMDSKNLLKGLDRKSPTFLISFYSLMLVASVFISEVTVDMSPVNFSLYYFFLSLVMSLTVAARR